MTERDKVTVDNIIGLVHTDEITNSVSEVRKLRGRKNERFILVEYVNKGLFIQDNANDETQYFQGSKASLEKVVDLLNSLTDENEQLKADKQSLIDFIKKEFPKSHKHILEGFND